MKNNLILLTFVVSGFTSAQVGINSVTPKATLDITAKATDASTAEGVIAPRLTGDQIQGKDAKYTADQIGTLIYATSAVTVPSGTKTANITSAGYYYFDGSKWITIATANGFDNTNDAWVNDNANTRVELGTQSDGTTARPAKTEFVIKNTGKVGIGTVNPLSKLHIRADVDNSDEDMILLDNNNGIFRIGRKSDHATFNMSGGRIIMESDVLMSVGKKIVMSNNANIASTNQRPAIRVDEINASGTRIAKVTLGETNPSEKAPFNITLASREIGGLAGTTLQGSNIKQVLTADNSNQNLIAVDINPTFNDNAQTGIKHYGLLVRSGDVGIGTANPKNTLHVKSSTNPLRLEGLEAGATTDEILSVDATGVVRKIAAAGSADIRLVGIGNHISQDAGVGSNGTSAGTGYSNIIVGNGNVNYPAAGNSMTTGYRNIFLGETVGNANTSGYRNTIVGAPSFTANSTGFENTAFGNSTLRFSNGDRNTVVGSYSMNQNTTGSNNVALGWNTLYENKTGSFNTAVGPWAGYSNKGDKNITIGYFTSVANNALSNQLSIGNLIYANGVDGTAATISSGNVGIGVKAPVKRLHIANPGGAAGTTSMKVEGIPTYATDADAAAGGLTSGDVYKTVDAVNGGFFLKIKG